MTARDYFTRYQVDGRALLTPPHVAWDFTGKCKQGRPDRQRQVAWLVDIRGQLILCRDQEEPAVKFVADSDVVRPKVQGDRYIVAGEPTRPVSCDGNNGTGRAYYWGRRTFGARNTLHNKGVENGSEAEHIS